MTTSVKAAIVNWAKWGVAHEPQIHYEEIRPMPLSASLPLTTDCSGFVTLCYYLAGAPDPNGLGYNHYGYTGTLLNHGQQIELKDVQPGDVIVYGPGTGWHTALIIEGGPDPLTVSHGDEAGPGIVRVSQDGRLPQTYLRFATNSRFPDPPKPVSYPHPHGTPTKAQIAAKKLVRVRKLGQLEAVKNGYHLYYWATNRFVVQVGGQPATPQIYVPANFRDKR